ncbi:MAG: hypothetical protein CMJ31_05340 [Phycisphaerae bacterium]|nr:hypothetical protein [Phycisphaerae bacterium]
MKRAATALALAATLAAAPPKVVAEPRPAAEVMAQREEAKDAGQAAIEALKNGDRAEAVRLLREQARLDPANFVPHYNLACVLGAMNELEPAQASLSRAVELGFASHSTLTTDPDLTPLRDTPLYHALIEKWPLVLEARRQAALAATREWMTSKPREHALDDLRLDVLSTLDGHATERALESITAATEWITTSLIPELVNGDATNDPWAEVILLEDDDFHAWLVRTFGPTAGRRGVSYIGGAYEHDRKRLVAQDVGATLRHELFHVLHTRHTERLGQRHPIWIQEGLASLLEDMDPHGAGWVPVPSYRTNIVKRLAGWNRLTPIDEIVALDQRTFVSDKPLRRYAEARGLFMYLLERGLLRWWYETYTTDPEHGYDADQTGLRAITHVTGQNLETFEIAWKDWAENTLPMVAEEIRDVDVWLGLDVNSGTGDGPRVQRVERAVRRESDIRIGDVILAIDGRPTGDLRELARILGTLRAGQNVTISYRRGRLTGDTQATVLDKD